MACRGGFGCKWSVASDGFSQSARGARYLWRDGWGFACRGSPYAGARIDCWRRARLVVVSGCSLCRRYGCDVGYLVFQSEGSQFGDAHHYRYDGGLSLFEYHHIAQLLGYRGGCAQFRCLGYGRFHECGPGWYATLCHADNPCYALYIFVD